MPDYKPQTIEQKWQERWRSERTFEVTEDLARPKFYCLEMFAYPSGHAHVGHVRNYMARGVESLIHYLRTEPSLNLDTSRYKGPLQDIIELVPVWRSYASALRVKFMLDRRAIPRD